MTHNLASPGLNRKISRPGIESVISATLNRSIPPALRLFLSRANFSPNTILSLDTSVYSCLCHLRIFLNSGYNSTIIGDADRVLGVFFRGFFYQTQIRYFQFSLFLILYLCSFLLIHDLLCLNTILNLILGGGGGGAPVLTAAARDMVFIFLWPFTFYIIFFLGKGHLHFCFSQVIF